MCNHRWSTYVPTKPVPAPARVTWVREGVSSASFSWIFVRNRYTEKTKPFKGAAVTLALGL